MKLPSNSKLKEHVDFVSLMSKHAKSPKKRQQLLTVASPGEVDACAEVFHNLLKGNIKVSDKDLKKLIKHKDQIRSLANKKTPRRQKKVLLGTQSGGFLPLLLPAVAPLVVKALQGVFGQ